MYSSPANCVSGTASPPGNGTLYRSLVPWMLPLKAIHRPSGDTSCPSMSLFPVVTATPSRTETGARRPMGNDQMFWRSATLA